MRGAVAPLVIEDAAEDERFRDHPGVTQHGIRSYIAVPVRRRDGRPFGTLCALDPRPAELPPALLRTFTMFGELIGHQLEEQEVHAERERFLDVLAHDLRNPLNAIHLASRAAAATGDAEAAALIARSVARMRAMIDDLADFTRGRIGANLPLEPEEIDAETLIRDAVDEIRSATARECRLDVRVDPPIGTARWDRTRVAQLLGNLLANAVAYSPAGSAVEVGVAATDERIEIAVVNEGEPIPTDTLRGLFRPFARGPGAGGTAGVGLGLYIAERVATAHGGSITVASSAATGTRLCVSLPRSPAEPTEPR